MNVGIYIDDIRAFQQQAARLRQTPITHFIFCVNRADGEAIISGPELDEICSSTLYTAGKPVVVEAMHWPPERFTLGYIDRMLSYLVSNHRLDVEANNRLVTEAEAGVFLGLCARLWADYRTVSVTTHPWHSEALAVKSNLFRVLGGEMQAYGTRSNRDRSGMAPGEIQRFAHRRGVDTCGAPVGLALPLYGQTDLGISPAESLALQVTTARQLGARAITFWSNKHLDKNPYAWPFLEQALAGLL